MVLLTCDGLSKAYSERKLLNDTGFSVESGDKVGVVGVNGTGKTTLLRILAEYEKPDSGSILKASALRIGYLPQNPVFEQNDTVLGYVMRDVRGTAKDYECKTILTKLELFDYEARLDTLSGGQKKRVALAAALVHEVDLLILDEPTNHIDNTMVLWLESYLCAYKGALLMVTHDRYFLDRVTNHILELDGGKLYNYNCNYSKYLERKIEREEMSAATARKRQSLLRKEVEWIHQGPCGRGTKSQYRIDRLKELQAQIADAVKTNVELLSMASRLGRKIIEFDHVSKGFGNKQLITDFSYLLLRDDRIGIIGRNGAGKSTLLKMIMGELAPDAGQIVVGDTVKIGYFAQQCENMDPAMRPIDYVKAESNAIETPGGVLTATQLLEKFLFFSDLQYTTISRLSGGERRRLYLLKVLMGAPNVLILDEPTNDLDIETLTILEDYLSTFAGAVIMVSHDRYFLDKLATRIFSVEDDGIKSTMGGYTDWAIQQEPAMLRTQAAEKEKPAVRIRSEKLKFSFNEKNEFAVIDDEIAELEQQLAELELAMQHSAADFARLQELGAQKELAQEQLDAKMERWVFLNELNDRISGQANNA